MCRFAKPLIIAEHWVNLAPVLFLKLFKINFPPFDRANSPLFPYLTKNGRFWSGVIQWFWNLWVIRLNALSYLISKEFSKKFKKSEKGGWQKRPFLNILKPFIYRHFGLLHVFLSTSSIKNPTKSVNLPIWNPIFWSFWFLIPWMNTVSYFKWHP